MSIFSESAEESLKKDSNIRNFNYYLSRGLSPEEISKLIGDKATYDGINANPYDFGMRYKLPGD